MRRVTLVSLFLLFFLSSGAAAAGRCGLRRVLRRPQRGLPARPGIEREGRRITENTPRCLRNMRKPSRPCGEARPQPKFDFKVEVGKEERSLVVQTWP